MGSHGKNQYGILASWQLFSPMEKRNILIYICGIMIYKFGLEAFNGAFIALATNRYDDLAERTNTTAKTFQRVGLLQGLNQACQCVGSILIAPLIKRYPTRLVLSASIFVFGLFSAIILIIDAATGGTLKPSGAASSDFSYYGDYNTDGMIPIYCITGIAYGMVELIRRVIPRDIVGGDVQKLRRMDALVHIFYEISGTSGAFCTALALIPRLGNNMAFIITPILFTFAAVAWFFISDLEHPSSRIIDGVDGVDAEDTEGVRHRNYFMAVLISFKLFFESVYTGGKILFSARKFVWLLPGYSLALYGHRYLENGLAPIIARRYLGNSAWSQIMVGGSNFGELLGALFVFLFTNVIKTPMPWLRLDALCLLIVWYLAYWYPARGDVTEAWRVAATFLPVSFGWAAGDVSLAAYIQASLHRQESKHKNVSALGAVMAFLYSTYVVLYAILSPMLGRHVDAVSRDNDGDVHLAVRNLGGIQFTVLAAIVIASTLIPKGALKFNPSMISDDNVEGDPDEERIVRGDTSDQDNNIAEKRIPDSPEVVAMHQ
ncbi:hypothetical protein PVAG01_02846 [Phlyctema vagabunda]|uniref:Major facilitator superfamily domain-containing protein n=1 Tax=Phlyctema vagabunda TaxID=108571 RepID=A0ABR4PRR3_9HELO